MASNIRNSRTTHPRKAARRQRAAERLYVDRSRMHEEAHVQRKAVEAQSLGVELRYR